MFLILIYIILLLLILHNYLYNNESAKLIKKIPGPKTNFLLGNVLNYLKSTVPLFYSTRKYANIYNGIHKFVLPGKNLVFLYNPEDVEVILSSQKHINKEYLYTFLHPWLGTGLLNSKGEKWQNRRKILTPAFHFNILKQFCNIFIDHSESLVKKLKKTEGQNVNITPLITDFTLHAICETAMGTNLDTNQKDAVDYKNAIYSLGRYFFHRVVRPWLHPLFTFDRSSVGIKQKETLNYLHKFTSNVINERRKTRAEYGNKFVIEDYVTDPDRNQKKRLAMLDLLISAESDGKIDADGIREEVDTFMFEGHDTTTAAITFTLFLLANNPEAQQLAYEEIQSILGDSETLGIENFNELKYLERCIKESLRLYPSVPAFGRHLNEDLHLKDYIIPAGTECEIHVYDMHRNPKLYPNPEKFDPDRFLPENCAKRHNFAYIPFSAGPRNCIGQKFALLEIKTVVSIIMKNFILEPVTKIDDVIFFADLVLRSKTPIEIKFLPRIMRADRKKQ